MSAERFRIARVDGRSNVEVVLDYVRDGQPGQEYSYGELSAALGGVGVSRVFDRAAVIAVVQQAFGRLLKEQQRALINLRGRGYRLAYAKDHRGLALARTRKADSQMSRGVLALQHVRIEELDAASRQVHEGTLMVLGAMYQQQQAMDKRLHAVERAIQDIKSGQG